MKKQILIAEDSPYVGSLLTHFLGKNYEIILKNDGAEALAWLQEGNKPDLILSDIMMPKIDGWRFLKNIRASAYFSDVPFIILSALEKSHQRIKSFELGANDYMVKPFNPQELKVRITNLINQGHARA